MKQKIAAALEKHMEACKKVQKDSLPVIEKIAQALIDCYKKGGQVLFMGNGGSASDAQHLATELVCRLKLERRALPAMALNTNTSIITAQGNDYGYDTVFSRQVEAFTSAKDVVVGLSTSGNSENVVRALDVANKAGAVTIGFTGGNGGKIAKIAKLNFIAPSDVTMHIQEMHISVGHILCDLVEEEMAKK